MSRGYSKVYNRKSNMLCPASIQFDKLFNENSNRPIAAKSAGTVGKWGVISCTSLRIIRIFKGTAQLVNEVNETKESLCTLRITRRRNLSEANSDFEYVSSLGSVESSDRELESGSSERAGSPFQKKGSIFKSRSLLSNGSRKRLALYKHKPAADSDPLDEQESITSVKCPRKAKGFYTVVRNVKKAHQIQESGEFQEFNDDVEYILDALQDNNPIGTRCLSAITLASKCMAPAFRMHVRAHGTVTKFFKSLHDATKDQSLGLCTATVMFVLSQDRLNMDLDRHSLELMLNLLESDASHRNALDDCGMSSSQLHKNKQKVGQLAMETLLSLTSRRAGEWFKEELRTLGGLEHIVKTICECCRQIDDYVVEWTDALLDKLRKVDRCLKVLENVTHQNEENQVYLLNYGNGVLLDTLVRLYCQCDSEISLYPCTNPADKESVAYGSALAGERTGLVDACLHLLLQVPNYVPEDKKFDLLVLALILLINLVESCHANRKLLRHQDGRGSIDCAILPPRRLGTS
uniref:WAPL domain-containing protein n=1 Tax=Timema monikensis TaxID=170555 RepID=A0A7R9DZR0_9NEOP|nr:unnamed protein product [Timema monikensis]